MGGVQQIESLEPVFDPALFADEPQGPTFGQRCVEIGETRSEQNVASESAVVVGSGIRKTGRIEICRQLLAFGAAGVKDRVACANQVHTRRPRAGYRVVRGANAEWRAGHCRNDRTQSPVTQDRVHFRAGQSRQIPYEGSDETMRSRIVGIPAGEKEIKWIVDSAASAKPVARRVVQVL